MAYKGGGWDSLKTEEERIEWYNYFNEYLGPGTSRPAGMWAGGGNTEHPSEKWVAAYRARLAQTAKQLVYNEETMCFEEVVSKEG